MGTSEALLALDDLHVHFRARRGLVRALNGVSFLVNQGEVCGVVGESGSGKSVMALATLGLLPPRGEVVRGKIYFQGEDLLKAGENRLRELRGQAISMILQDPMTALNPVLTIGTQVGEPLVYHAGLSGSMLEKRICRLLEQVRIPQPISHLRAYPHQFSGGMRQRVAAAAAIAAGPRLLIADEPTTALDVSLQAEFLRLLRDLQRETGMTILLISHDLQLILEFAHRVVVMYAGQVVEDGPANTVLLSPQHPYTQALLSCVPRLGRWEGRLASIPGTPPDPAALPPGCPFMPRCSELRAICHTPPPKVQRGFLHIVCCWAREKEIPG